MALAPEEVGARIKAARIAKGLMTHDQFRDAVNERFARRVNLRTVQRWQTGRNPKTGKSWLPRLDTLMDLADLLEVPRSQFVEEEQDGAAPAAEDRLARLEEHARVQQALHVGNAKKLSELLKLVRELREGLQSREG